LTIHPDGSGLTAVVKNSGPACQRHSFFACRFQKVRWSPDGTKLIFSGWLDPSQGRSLWMVDADGTNLTKMPISLQDPFSIIPQVDGLGSPDWGTHPLQ